MMVVVMGCFIARLQAWTDRCDTATSRIQSHGGRDRQVRPVKATVAGALLYLFPLSCTAIESFVEGVRHGALLWLPLKYHSTTTGSRGSFEAGSYSSWSDCFFIVPSP